MKTDDQIRTEVRDHYSAIARSAQTAQSAEAACCEPTSDGTACCAPAPASAGTDTSSAVQTGCCAPTSTPRFDRTETARALGYSDADLLAVPELANLGLGCGNPQAIAELRPGEVVVDLGAGGGFDAFLAARAVGPTGTVIGVDMSADMVALARANAAKHGTRNAEFRLGEIEHLPVADASADVVMSNCVINLAPDKRAVYADAFRVLKPGGRIAISDVVALAAMPAHLADDVAARCGCIAGAALASELPALLESVGFTDVSVEVDEGTRELIADWAPGLGYERYVASARIRATKPAHASASDGAKNAAGESARATRSDTAGESARATRNEDAGTARACCGPECCA